MSNSEPIKKNNGGRWPWDCPVINNFQYILERTPEIHDLIYGTNFAQPVKQIGTGRKRSRQIEKSNLKKRKNK